MEPTVDYGDNLPFAPESRLPLICSFHLNRDSEVYYVGETIEGTVYYRLHKEEFIKDFTVNFHGKIVNKFFEKKKVVYDTYTANDNDYNIVCYTSQEDFYNTFEIVESKKTLGPGIYDYQFKIELLPDLYSSFEGAYGHIRYELSFKKNKYERNKVYRHAVTVLRQEDLNLDRKNKLCRSASTQISVTLTSCLKARVRFNLTTLFSGYVPGQVIKYVLEVHKTDTQSLENFRVALVRRAAYICHTPRYRIAIEEMVLAESICGDQDLRFFLVFGDLTIPSTPPTIHTELIATDYLLRAEARARYCLSSVVKAEVKIRIGTTPVVASLEPSQFVPKIREGNDDVPGCSSENVGKTIKPPIYLKGAFKGNRFDDRDIIAYERITYWMPSYPVYEVSLPETMPTIADSE